MILGGGSELEYSETSNEIKFERLVDWFLTMRDTSNHNINYMLARTAFGGSTDSSWTHNTLDAFDEDYEHMINVLKTCYTISETDMTSEITRIPNSKMNYRLFQSEFMYNVILANRITDVLGMTDYVGTTGDTLSGYMNYGLANKGKTLASIIGGTTKVIDHMNSSRWSSEPRAYIGDPNVPFFEFSEEYRV